MSSKDPSHLHEAKFGTTKEVQYRIDLDKYIGEGIGSNIEKMQSFPKYVPRQTLTHFLGRYELFKQVLNVQGSIMECGVFLGGGLMGWAQFSAIFEPVNHGRRIVGFDTFSGFADLAKEDEKGLSEFSHKGGLAADSYEDLKRAIQIYDANRSIGHIEKVKLVKGDATVTIPKYVEDNPHTVVSLLYLDFDVFAPTKVAIESFLPRMPKGAILAFDELNTERWPGETLAVVKSVGIDRLRIQRFSFDSNLSFAVLE
jgi:Macrocin-O-methyltransferase (TylF)